MPESFATRLARLKFNFFPTFRGTGGRLTFIADDFREIHVKIPLNWRTRNYVGTTYGGSLYGAVDPIYMIMLIKNLGRDYVVWGQSRDGQVQAVRNRNSLRGIQDRRIRDRRDQIAFA